MLGLKLNHVSKRGHWYQGSYGLHGAYLGPTGPKWAPCWPHDPCYLGGFSVWIIIYSQYPIKSKPLLSRPSMAGSRCLFHRQSFHIYPVMSFIYTGFTGNIDMFHMWIYKYIYRDEFNSGLICKYKILTRDTQSHKWYHSTRKRVFSVSYLKFNLITTLSLSSK